MRISQAPGQRLDWLGKKQDIRAMVDSLLDECSLAAEEGVPTQHLVMARWAVASGSPPVSGRDEILVQGLAELHRKIGSQ